MDKPYVIGIDMGGTNTVFGVVDVRGHIIARSSIKMHKNVESYLDELWTEIEKLIGAVGGKDSIRAIGLGCPNGNYYTGNIEFAPNLPWDGVIPFANLMAKKSGLPCKLTNDANAAAVGEMTYGAARGMKNFIIITLGTGVGSGIVVNGEVVYGHYGFAGELGHTTAIRDGRQCGCGRKGCLETYTSATGVARTAKEIIAETNKLTSLRDLKLEEITSKDVYDAAIAGDEVAIDIFNTTGEILGRSFADFVAFSEPESIIMFGGLTKAGDLIMNPIRKAMDENLLKFWKGKIKLQFSALREADAAVLGASALGWEIKE
ncbi:MAG: ROK family protein [Bacteroidales bacterium]